MRSKPSLRLRNTAQPSMRCKCDGSGRDPSQLTSIDTSLFEHRGSAGRSVWNCFRMPAGVSYGGMVAEKRGFPKIYYIWYLRLYSARNSKFSKSKYKNINQIDRFGRPIRVDWW